MDTTRPSLLLRIRDRGDAEAWETFDRIYRPMLGRFARGRGLSEADADDVVQHCMSAIAEHIGSFAYDPSRGRFKAWLRTLVNNRIRSLHRARRPAQAGTDELARRPDREGSPDAEFDRIWAEEHLWHCMRELEETVDRTTFLAFRLYAIEGQPIETVVARTGLTRQNLYTIKWRLTERIAGRMAELDRDDE